jgi:hypothetical protein
MQVPVVKNHRQRPQWHAAEIVVPVLLTSFTYSFGLLILDRFYARKLLLKLLQFNPNLLAVRP